MGKIEEIIINGSGVDIIIAGAGSMSLPLWSIITALALSVAFFLAIYIFMGIGLRRMAINRDMKQSYLAFVPFARFYLIGLLIGKSRFFGKPVKNLGVIVMSVYVAFITCFIVYNVLNYLPIVLPLLNGSTISLIALETGGYEIVSSGMNVVYAPWVRGVMQFIFYVQYFVDIANFFFMLMLYSELYKKYAPEHYFLYSILSALFNVGGIIVFCVRKRKAVNYMDFVKERYMKMTGGYMNPNIKTSEDPFKEYAKKGDFDPGDPFGEFSAKKPDDTAEKPNDDNNNNNDGFFN